MNSIQNLENYFVGNDYNISSFRRLIQYKEQEFFWNYILYLSLLSKDMIVYVQNTADRDPLKELILNRQNSIIVIPFSKGETTTRFFDELFANQLAQTKVINRPIVPKTYTQIIQEHKTEKIFINVTKGIKIDLERNNLIIISDEERYSRANISFDFALPLFKPFMELSTELKEQIRIKQEALYKVLFHKIEQEIKTQRINHFFNKITEDTKRNLSQQALRIDEDLNSLELQYNSLLHDKELLYFRRNTEVVTDKDKAITLLDRLVESNVLREYVFDYPNLIYLYYKPLKILFMDDMQLKKVIPNISKSEEHKKYLNALLEKTHYLYSLPLAARIRITKGRYDSPVYVFDTLTTQHYYARYNGHPLHSDGRGCRGTFALEMQDACNNLCLTKLIALITQYYQTITVADMYGDRLLRNGSFVNEETGLLEYDAYTDKELAEPLDLKYFVDTKDFESYRNIKREEEEKRKQPQNL